MKMKLLPVLLVFIGIGFSSCQKCVECENCPLGISADACVEDFDSKEDYEQAVSDAEAVGCDCTEKLSGS